MRARGAGALAARNMALGGRETYDHLPVVTSHGAALGLEVGQHLSLVLLHAAITCVIACCNNLCYCMLQ